MRCHKTDASPLRPGIAAAQTSLPRSTIMAVLRHIFFAFAATAATLFSGNDECMFDDCACAVVDHAPAIAVALKDCSQFMKQTVTATITAAATLPHERQKQGRSEELSSGIVPGYASACRGSAAYASVCSCWNITMLTTTVKVTATVSSITCFERTEAHMLTSQEFCQHVGGRRYFCAVLHGIVKSCQRDWYMKEATPLIIAS